MKPATRTPAERAEYMRGLRNKWNDAKVALDEGMMKEIEAAIATHGLNVSARSYFIVQCQMRALGLEGIPYLDCKTFKGWRENGYSVAKGEHSKMKGITWIGGDTAADKGEVLGGEKKFVYPKEYHLFHRSQVIALAA